MDGAIKVAGVVRVLAGDRVDLRRARAHLPRGGSVLRIAGRRRHGASAVDEDLPALRPSELGAAIAALKQHGVYLEGAVLKPNMVKNGLEGPKAPTEKVAELTIGVLKRTVPVAMPGIFFLSGETALDEDNEEEATNNLNAINKLAPNTPWSVSFSYGKASQKTTIVTWMGDVANNHAAQQALLARAKANSDACKGTYTQGACASVGVDGNIQQAAGAY